MVYRITVLSFLHPALMSDHWLLSQPLTLRRIHFRKTQTSPSPPRWKCSRYETEEEAEFFLSSRVDNSQIWPLQNEVHAPQGRERERIKTGAERKHVTGGVSLLFACILSFACVLFFWFFPTIFNIPSLPSQIQNHIRPQSSCVAGTCWRGWFKLMNVLWDLSVFAGYMSTSHAASMIGCSHMMKILVQPAS